MKPVPLPPVEDLWRLWPLVSVPDAIQRRDLALTAHHEAGHVVLMEWAGVIPSEATASAGNGLARFAPEQFADAPDSVDLNNPTAAAQAAAVYHAGIVAELIFAGLPWQGITVRRSSTDWASAREIMRACFGNGTAGHGYSQRVAYTVLTNRWSRVRAIAEKLTSDGVWKYGSE